MEIEINSVGVFDAGGFKLYLVAEVDGDTSVSRCRPVADAGDECARSLSGRGRLYMCGSLGMRGCSADDGERRSEKDAAERIFSAAAHADDSLGFWAVEREGIRWRVLSRVPVGEE